MPPRQEQQAATRRALLCLPLLTPVLPALAAEEATAEVTESVPLAVKFAKLGGVLVFADVLAGLMLGKSVLKIGKGKEAGGGDWKDAVADKLLGKESGAVAVNAESGELPTATLSPNRVSVLVKRVKGRKEIPGLRFEDVLDVINAAYTYTPTEYLSGAGGQWEVVNPAGKNEGSCKVFYFAQMHDLTPQETVALFAQYAAEVEATPQGTSHANIRAFQRTGWKGIQFKGTVLTPK